MDEWRKKVNDFSRDRKIKKSETSMDKYKEHWYKIVSQKIKDRKIIESNGLIAQFMGYDIDDKNEFFHGIHYYKMDSDSDKTYDQLTIDNVRSFTTDGFVWNYTDFTERRYDNSWDYIMPVFHKINDILFDTAEIQNKKRFVFNIGSNWAKIKTHTGHTFSYKKDIKADLLDTVYYVIVHFIKQYNKEKK